MRDYINEDCANGATHLPMGAVAELDALKISLPLPQNALFFDYGFVPSLMAQRKELDMRYGSLKSPEMYDESKFTPFFGEHWSVVGKPELPPGHRHHFIYFLHQNVEAFNIYSRGHEETHVLDHLGRLDLLADKLLREQGVSIDFSKLTDSTFDQEVKAEVGGICALNSRGYGIEVLSSRVPVWGFLDAKILYEQSRTPMRTINLPSFPVQQFQPA